MAVRFLVFCLASVEPAEAISFDDLHLAGSALTIFFGLFFKL
jgi:hypothetical protein